jgi:hypothetical protein
MHMRPLAPGQVMVNDFSEDVKLIDAALKLATLARGKKSSSNR